MASGNLDLRAGIRARTKLLTSVAGACMIATSPAFAAPPEDDPVGRPDLIIQREAQGNELSIADLQRDIDAQLVIADPGTPTTARDPVNVNGIGQMIIDQQNGFIGLCTGTLINPRTVLFAAHCVNERAANAYGQNSGGQPIGFGFSNNNNQAGASAFGGWLGNYATNTSRYMYDVNYVAYNPLTLEPGNRFIYGDIAVASLDTPAANVPTWAVLFSQLPDPGTITASGTGYHVDLSGYGNNGTGTTGSTGGIDFRRRVAENMIGALASLDDFESFLFGPSTGLPQNLYWIDFDDPRRGSGDESIFDFNAWRDNATANEGITASGDSGGPLILDQEFTRQVVIGVLSGGYTRFFPQQAPNGYGTASFYQPLYLYWDWIAANNPYHYVASVAGDGNWSDPNHWVTTLDPNYQIIGPNGQLMNGLPGTPGSTTADEDGYGQACFQDTTSGICYDVASGDFIDPAPPIGEAGDGSAVAAVSTINGGGVQGQGQITQIEGVTAQGGGQGPQGVLALPPATLENGLPGATNFVPNNYDGNRLTSTKPRYFDVTLAANGTTTLNSSVVIDRFTIAGGGARLDITAGGTLSSLIDVTHSAGVVNVAGAFLNGGKYTISGANAKLDIATGGAVTSWGEFHQLSGIVEVDGGLRSYGDYMLFAGGLTGSGTIAAPNFTNIIGTIAPGTAGTIGNLTFNGNLILTSGSALLIDLGDNGASDRVIVRSTLPWIDGVAQDGFASLGGNVAFGAAGGHVIRAGETFTILTAEGGLVDPATKRFNGVPISAILSPTFLYSANAVRVQITAGDYADVIDSDSGVQSGFAQLLDQNRGNAALGGIYTLLDLQNAATIRATLDGLSPDGETTIRSLGIAATQSMSNFFQDRIAGLDTGSLGGTLAFNGNPVQLASASLGGMVSFVPDVRTDASEAILTQENVLPETMRAYIAGGYLNGHSAPMWGSPLSAEDEDYDGWFGAAGIEALIGDSGAIGLALSYTQVESSELLGRTAEGQLYQGTLYGKIASKGGMVFDGMLSAGLFDTNTERAVTFVGTGYTLTAEDSALAVTAELGMGQSFDLGTAIELTPRAAFRYGHVGYSRTAETGGPVALVYDREPVESMQGRVGFNLNGTGTGFRPYLAAYYVHDFEDRPAVFGANFVGGVGPNALFALNGVDHDWGEISGGLTYSTGKVDISIAAETNFERSDVSSQAYHGSVTIHF